MTTTASNFVNEGLNLITAPLATFVETHFENALGEDWQKEVMQKYPKLTIKDGSIEWDNLDLLKVINMGNFWGKVFQDKLSRTDRSIVNELIDVRHKHAHYRVSTNDKADSPTQNESFSDDQAKRALDSMQRLMQSIGADEVATKIRDIHSRIGNRSDEQPPAESESLLLLRVETDKLVKNKSYTVLHFEGGATKQMITTIFDKDGLITKKAKSLVGKRVKTKCWEDKNKPPGFYANMGYFNEIDEA